MEENLWHCPIAPLPHDGTSHHNYPFTILDFLLNYNFYSAPTSQPFTSVSPLCDAVEGLLTRLAKEKRLLREEEEKKEALFLNLMNLYDDLLTNVLLWFRESLPITSQEQVAIIDQYDLGSWR